MCGKDTGYSLLYNTTPSGLGTGVRLDIRLKKDEKGRMGSDESCRAGPVLTSIEQ